MTEQNFKTQIEEGSRFEFGDNWRSFLNNLNEERINVAKDSLTAMLGYSDLEGKSFLDIGNGSGLFSLAAKRLGANVHSFDFDPSSVACARELKQRYFENDVNWQIEEASVLDTNYLSKIGKFDIVYSWGVLHHTGKMWDALANVNIPLKEEGKLYIAIYNDQGVISNRWRWIKKMYNSNRIMKQIVKMLGICYFALKGFIADVIKFKNPFLRYIEYKKNRGMSMLHDWIDWLGGYPFEVATPDAIFDFYKEKNYQLDKLITRQGLGCNIFVFTKVKNN